VYRPADADNVAAESDYVFVSGHDGTSGGNR
jgi:hypothetical protein